jgi:hypothetical protein
VNSVATSAIATGVAVLVVIITRLAAWIGTLIAALIVVAALVASGRA